MASKLRRHAVLHLERRSPVAATAVESIPLSKVADTIWPQLPDLTRRDAAATTTCAQGSGENGCEHSGSSSSNVTTAIVVGVVYAISHST